MIFLKFPFSETLYSTDENPQKSCISFVSFKGSQTLRIPGELQEISRKEVLNSDILSDSLNSELVNIEAEDQEDYQNKIKEVIEFVKKNNLHKLVIARIKRVDFHQISETGSISLSKTFLNLCDAYPNAFCYFFIQNNECWIGAFSELLGKFNRKTSGFTTMSLAGTLPLDENWTNKEIEEQQPVSTYISSVLSKFSAKVQQSETYDHISGNIKHLRTDFQAEIHSEDLDQLIAELHPTPAVCGIPKDFCKNAILNFEKFSRKFYAGYSKIETEEEVLFFVNLRCAEFRKNEALLYVGGGINALSDPAKEWRETELKAQAVLNSISV